eukprot:COSAG05_NODE_187_length_14703_cov_123.022186_3_plen_199_part_00
MLLRAFCVASLALAAAQDEPAAEASEAAEAAEAPPPPAKCPLSGGGFQELYAVATLLASQDKIGEAEACLSDAITTSVPAYRLLSDIATNNGQFGRAAGIAGIIETLLNNGDSKLYYSRKLLRVNQNEEAKTRLDALAEANTDNGDIFHLLGIAEFRLGNNDTAVASLEKAIAADPDSQLYKDELDVLKKAIAGEDTA